MNKDIKYYLYHIKESIKAIENGEIDSLILEETEGNFLEMFELIKMFLISEREIYYGYFLMNMQLSVNFYVSSTAGIKLNTYPPVLETNPLLLCKYSIKEIIYIICHEIEHIILNHPAEMVRCCDENDNEMLFRFNLAADASVNDRINQDIIDTNCRFLSQPDDSINSRTLSEIFDIGDILPLESYAYYFSLIQNKDSDSSSTGSDNRHSNKSENEDNEDNIVTAQNCGELQDHNWEAEGDSEDVQAVTREFVNQVVNTMSDESREMMTERFFSDVEIINKPPKLSWQKILKKYIGSVSAGKRKTRLRLNRRQPERYDLSGTMEDKILKIVVAIDTSASVDDKMLSYIFNEIFSILSKRRHEITIIECDSKIQRVYKAKNRSEIQKRVVGRGGTEFSPVIKYINENKCFRDALLIYFTDGFGEEQIPKPFTYKNMWVIVDRDNYLSLKEPYGVKLSLF